MYARLTLRIAPLLLVLLIIGGCQLDSGTTAADVALENSLQKVAEAAVAENPAIHGVAVRVDTPTLGLVWEGAAGFADSTAERAMRPEIPVRIASNTKTFVAASVLRLQEQGLLNIDDSLAQHLSQEYLDPLEANSYDPQRMTVRHLLTHTSGLFDHSESGNYETAIVADPMHRWTPFEQFSAAMEWGEPHAAPGEIYTYCDTGYILLGEIIGKASGKPLAEAVRELVGYEQLGLASTWWESLEPRPDGVPERAHQLLGELDTFGFDPSFDLYGGGGIVSTVGDMALFFRALFTGGVFAEPQTLEIMLTTVESAEARSDAGASAMPPGAYRMGVWMVEVDGFTTYRHTGFWGTLTTYLPDLDLTVAYTVNQNQSGSSFNTIAEDVIRLVAEKSP